MKNKIHQKLQKGQYIMHGKHPVLAALTNKKRYIDNVFCTQDIFDSYKDIIGKHRYQIVKSDFFPKILERNQTHQGIAAILDSIILNEIPQEVLLADKSCIAILDQVTDPHNIGAIIRSAASFDILTIIIPQDNTPSENSTIAKAACGTLELINLVMVTNLKNTMNLLKKHGFWIIGLDTRGEPNLKNNLLSSEKVAIAIGSEDKGLRKLTAENCDCLIKIPMSEEVESLNVSNASSIIFHTIYENRLLRKLICDEEFLGYGTVNKLI